MVVADNMPMIYTKESERELMPQDESSSASLQSSIAKTFAGYNGGDEMPLASYAALVGVFNTAFAALLLTAKNSGRPLPERISYADLVLLGVATHKLSRIITNDRVTSPSLRRHSKTKHHSMITNKTDSQQHSSNGTHVQSGSRQIKLDGDELPITINFSSKREGKQQVVVVTGASAGVGRAVVRRFAQEGAHIGLLARGLDGLEGTCRDVERLGGKALICQTDVADHEAVERAAQAVEDEFGTIDVWVNNATTSVFSPIKEMTAAEFKRVTEVTYLGVVYGTQAALKRMLPRDRGTIVQVGSALAYRSIPLQSAYCASKHAIQGFTESLRSELIHDESNVHVTMVHLPAVNTPQFGWNKSRLPRHPQPAPPIYQPEVMADAIYFAAHNTRREMTVGLPAVVAIYGNKVAPGLGDLYLGKYGYDSQQTDELIDPNRPNNLWEPVPGDHGAHGIFDDRSYSFSPQAWANMNRGWLALAGAGLLAGVALLRRKKR